MHEQTAQQQANTTEKFEKMNKEMRNICHKMTQLIKIHGLRHPEDLTNFINGNNEGEL